MKTTAFVLILLFTGLDLGAQTSPVPHQISNRFQPVKTNASPAAVPVMPTLPVATPSAAPAVPTVAAPSAAPVPATAQATAPAEPAANAEPPEEMIPAGNINFQGVDVSQVLEVYAKLVGRTLLRAGLPQAPIVLKTETPLTKSEAIQALQAVLALNGISVVNIGDKFVKVLPVADANSAGAAFNNKPADELPDLGAYVTHIVQLRNVKPSEMMPILQPFAKLPNAIVPIDSNGILVLRDNAENVKRMLQMIDKIDVSVPAVYISEVIPIKYALASDIASALNSLGGSGGSTVAIGSSAGGGSSSGAMRSSVNGFNNQSRTGIGGTTGFGGNPTSYGNTTPNGAPSGGGSTFQDRLRSIIQRASGGGNQQQDQIQVFGQTKIIADERSNSLLVFATRDDMERIKAIVDKLDVLLSQVLIESVIMEVSLGKTLGTGVSFVQEPSAINSPNFKGTGGFLNGPGFFQFIKGATNLINSPGTNLTGGLSYFGQIGDSDYDIAIQAAASDNSISIIQKPRIQTFQAQKATFFVGQTVPYVTGSTYGSAYGNSSSYAQLSVGVELDVTPFINPDGLVVMEINEEIDDINGSTFIEGVGNVPNTDKRTLSSEVAVKDRDTIILGGAIRSQKNFNKSGVPLLQDIPLLGALFSQRSSSKSRDELLVLMRPTVLKTPEIAAKQAKAEEARLPGISHADAEDKRDEAKQIQAEQRAEAAQAAKDAKEAAKAAAKERKHGKVPAEVPSPASDTTVLPPVNP